MKFNPILQTTYLDFPDNESIAVALYVYGCSNNCRGCHNYELQDVNNPEALECTDVSRLTRKIIGACKRNDTKKVVILGGDPLHPNNVDNIRNLIMDLYFDGYQTCIYTGYSIEHARDLLSNGFNSYVTFIKAGPFIDTLYQEPYKTDDEMVLASSNQEFYNRDYNKISKNGILKFKK